MRDDQHRRRRLDQERFDGLPRDDIEVVRRLVEEVDVRRHDPEQRELQARPLAAREQADLLERVVASEQEPRQVAARLAGGHRSRLEDGVDHCRSRKAGGAQLGQVAELDPMAELDRAIERRQLARDRPQQGRLPCPVRAHDPDPLAAPGREERRPGDDLRWQLGRRGQVAHHELLRSNHDLPGSNGAAVTHEAEVGSFSFRVALGASWRASRSFSSRASCSCIFVILRWLRYVWTSSRSRAICCSVCPRTSRRTRRARRAAGGSRCSRPGRREPAVAELPDAFTVASRKARSCDATSSEPSRRRRCPPPPRGRRGQVLVGSSRKRRSGEAITSLASVAPSARHRTGGRRSNLVSSVNPSPDRTSSTRWSRGVPAEGLEAVLERLVRRFGRSMSMLEGLELGRHRFEVGGAVPNGGPDVRRGHERGVEMGLLGQHPDRQVALSRDLPGVGLVHPGRDAEHVGFPAPFGRRGRSGRRAQSRHRSGRGSRTSRPRDGSPRGAGSTSVLTPPGQARSRGRTRPHCPPSIGGALGRPRGRSRVAAARRSARLRAPGAEDGRPAPGASSQSGSRARHRTHRSPSSAVPCESRSRRRRSRAGRLRLHAAQDRRAAACSGRGRRWHHEQKWVARPPTTTRRIGRPQRAHGSPARWYTSRRSCISPSPSGAV